MSYGGGIDENSNFFLPFSFIGGAERLFLETVTLLRERTTWLMYTTIYKNSTALKEGDNESIIHDKTGFLSSNRVKEFKRMGESL